MKGVRYFTIDQSGEMGGHKQLKCCLCGEEDRQKLKVEMLGIAAGMKGDDYSFCRRCWNSKNLGKNILRLLDYPRGLKLLDSIVDKETMEGGIQ